LMDVMIDEEENGKAEYVSFQSIKDRFTDK
jgi:hypothetical protein